MSKKAKMEKPETNEIEAAPRDERVILTRNFLNKDEEAKAPKYCVVKFGEAPKTAKQAEVVELLDAKSFHVVEHAETYGFNNFGCGILIIGTPASTFSAEAVGGKKIRWAGFEFQYVNGERTFSECYRLVATREGITVWG